MGNGTKVGLATGIGIVLVGVMAALFVWRLVEGDTPADASAYVLLILGTVSGLVTAGFRWWQNVKVELNKPPS